MAAELLRGAIFHTPRNPFYETNACEFFSDGGLLIDEGRVRALGDHAELRRAYPEAAGNGLRGGIILPGFIDTHTHFPQARVLGGLGHTLLDWLDRHALPEEARMANPAYAQEVAAEFVQGLVSNGTTTALVFGAHFERATAILFETAARAGMRLFSGLTLSDRLLRADLHQTPDDAYRSSKELIRAFHKHRNLHYAVTPRFALSTSEAMLEVCAALLREQPDAVFQTHLNENPREIEEVARLFPWAQDYLDVYDHFGLVQARSVFAHNVHPAARELHLLGERRASVAYCPASNAALGSGFFPLRAHLDARVHFALGTDVAGGTGFGMPKEALQAYLLQRLSPGGFLLTPDQLLYLATRAGAESLGIGGVTGDLSPGKSADFVYLSPPSGHRADSPECALASIMTLASAREVREVRVAGEIVYPAGTA